MNLWLRLKTGQKYLMAEYLPTAPKRWELVLIIAGYLFALILINNIPVPYQGVIAALQSLIVFFLAFRFRALGLFIALIFNGNEMRIITSSYLRTHSPEYIIAIAAKIFTVAAVILIGSVASKQEQHKKLLQHLVVTDGLTGVFNQRFFMHNLSKQMENSSPNGLGLIMLDIDNFKLFNDAYGHECGDEVLKGTGALLNRLVCEGQTVYRCGGDEFAIIVPQVQPDALEDMAQDLQKRFKEERKHFFSQNLSEKITLSMGLSYYPEVAATRDDLLNQADMALYHAKNLGKDKVHFYQDVIRVMRKDIPWQHQEFIGAFKALLSTISAKDKYTLGHSERVAAYAVRFSEALGLPAAEISALQYAGLLHDIGKIEVPRAVLNKKGKLTDEEVELLHAHPVTSQLILEPLEDMGCLLDYIRHHHERYDGGGYPDGLAGGSLSLGARILSIADSYDAMLSERPYSKSMRPEEAMNELKKCAGSQFDPGLVDVFIDAVASSLSSPAT